MITTYAAAPGVDVLTTTIAIPGMGNIPVNAFLLQGDVPVLVDTGVVAQGDEFMTALASLIDPSTIEWIWLTHTDFDHIGALHRVLDANPNARVVTSFLGVGIMGLSTTPIPMERAYLINPGQSISLGTRTLTAFKPPAFDNPVTTGFHDDSTGFLYSADCFGAMLQTDIPQRASDLGEAELRQGQVFWATADSPWLHNIDPALLDEQLDTIREMEPAMVLSAHLPPAPASMTELLLGSLAAAPTADHFAGPDQAALELMMAAG
jgi:flavorubredoxin